MLRFVGDAANCKIVFHESPHFHDHRKTSKDLNNCANKQAFIVTLRVILPGEELRWKYIISQPYRMLPAPPSPAGTPVKAAANAGTPGQATVDPALSGVTALPRAATAALAQRRIYGHDHTHAHALAHAHAAPPSPFSTGTNPPAKRARDNADAGKNPHDDGLDPDCICHNGERKCKMNYCWFQNGRIATSTRRAGSNSGSR